MQVAHTLPFGNAPQSFRGGGFTPQQFRPPQQSSPTVFQKIHKKLDVDGDGDVDLADAMLALEKFNKENNIVKMKYKCVECDKGMRKKSKYGTQVCVECYRNPSDEMRCISTVSSGARCKRRKHKDSSLGYCGIHMKKHSEPLPFYSEAMTK